MTNSADMLMLEEGRRALARELAALIRAGEHARADAVLVGLLETVPSNLARLALSLPAEAVTIEGWDDFNTRMAQLAQSGAVTAVGVDITDQGDAVDAQGRREQTLQSVYYGDSAGFDFRAAGRDGILAQTEEGATPPWTGCFEDVDGALTVRGLAPLYDAMLQQPEQLWSPAFSDAQRRENLAAWLAAWVRHLRVHQAVHRRLMSDGLALDVPVLVGANETPPYFEAVYYPRFVRDHSTAAAARQQQQNAAERARYDRDTEEQIALWRERRDALREWSVFVNPDKRRTFVQYAEASDRIVLRGTPLEGSRPPHELANRKFERFIQTWRHHRDPVNNPAPEPSGWGSIFKF